MDLTIRSLEQIRRIRFTKQCRSTAKNSMLACLVVTVSTAAMQTNGITSFSTTRIVWAITIGLIVGRDLLSFADHILELRHRGHYRDD